MSNTTSEGLLLPLGTETVTRQAYLDNVNATNTALAKKANKDGTLQTTLNADMLDGLHSTAFATVAQGTKAEAALPATSYTANDILTKIQTVDGIGSGLDADTVDGYHQNQDMRTTASPTHVGLTLSQATGTSPLTITSTTRVTNLSADMVDGWHASNLSGNVPVSNGTVNTNLNADKVDGFDAGVTQGQVLAIPTGGVAGQALLLQANGTLAWGDAGMICKTIKSADLYQATVVANTLYTLLSVSGKGQLTRLSAFDGSTNTNQDITFVVTIDGGAAVSIAQSSASGGLNSRGIAGDAGYNRGCFFDWLGQISFTTSLLVQVKNSTVKIIQASADYAIA